jgi:hypothetical protein
VSGSHPTGIEGELVNSKRAALEMQHRPRTIGALYARITTLGITRVAGWIAVAFGVTHVVVAPLNYQQAWSEILAKGPWQTLSLDVTPENRVYSEAFWVGPGSFGVPILLIGTFVLWTARRGEHVPAPFAWAMTAWGAGLVVLLPRSPAWALLVVGVLLVLAARTGGGQADPRSDQPGASERRRHVIP